MHRWEEKGTKEGEEEKKRTDRLINVTGRRRGYRSDSRGDEEDGQTGDEGCSVEPMNHAHVKQKKPFRLRARESS